jgi:hypothetical protein
VKTLEQAKKKAEELISSRDKVAWLLSQCIHKGKQNYEFLLAPWESLQILLRMVRCWLGGRYSAPILSILGVVAALVYFVEPFDLIPDPIPVLAYLDDAAARVSKSYFLAEEPAKAVATPNEMSMPPET